MDQELEVVIFKEIVLFSWHDPVIGLMAEELGEPEFDEPRPCG